MLLLALTLVASPATPRCDFDRAAMLALDQDRFDQDMTGGWRSLEERGCEQEAADLLRDWRTAHGSSHPVLIWHEGQLRADIGQTQRAIALFERSYKPADVDAGMGWNLYVDGSIAFLRRDRAGLEAARAKLTALLRPADFEFTGPDGKPVAVAWPMNLNVLDGFRRCWKQPYKQAYGCATPIMRRKLAPASQ